MALFFDQRWFDERLAKLGLQRETVAAALGLDNEALAEVWKDQRELLPDQVATLAHLIGEPVEEVVSRAGVATPTPTAAGSDLKPVLDKLEQIEQRLARLEEAVARLLDER